LRRGKTLRRWSNNRVSWQWSSADGQRVTVNVVVRYSYQWHGDRSSLFHHVLFFFQCYATHRLCCLPAVRRRCDDVIVLWGDVISRALRADCCWSVSYLLTLSTAAHVSLVSLALSSFNCHQSPWNINKLSTLYTKAGHITSSVYSCIDNVVAWCIVLRSLV